MNYRGISVLASVSRILSKIINIRLESLIQNKISEEQAGFTTDKSCVDHIFTIRQMMERMLTKGKEIHFIFIDLEKAYDTVPVNRLWTTLQKTGVPTRLIDLTRRMYKCIACLKMGENLSAEFCTTKGLRQKRGMLPPLFKIFLENASKKWNDSRRGMGINIDSHILHTLLFADDQVIVGQDQ